MSKISGENSPISNKGIHTLKKFLREQPLTRAPYISAVDAIKDSFFFYIPSLSYYKNLNPVTYTKEICNEKRSEAQKVYQEMEKNSGNDDLLPVAGQYVHPTWENILQVFRDTLFSSRSENFLRNKKIRHCFSLNATLGHHSNYFRYILDGNDFFTDFFKNTFKDSRVGGPRIVKTDHFVGKPDSIDHLYYLARIMRYAKRRGQKVESIVEIGGGYGNFAYCARLFNPNITHTIIDFPEILSFVYLYSAINFPKLKIHIFNGSNGIQEGALNLVPVSLLPRLTTRHDVFISTYALTETPENLINYVKNNHFLNSRTVYIQGGTDHVFNSHNILLKNLESVVEFTKDSSYTDPGCYELIGEVR